MRGLIRFGCAVFMIGALSGFTGILLPPPPIAPVMSPALPMLHTTSADLAAQIQRVLPTPEPVSGTLTVHTKHQLRDLATNA